ncbi:hypothetical protein [Methylomonas sp. HYX-M1]|uniref:hypothetical protein n=1 Tax=Methylomonas sp. HYX-M1 TaxID=3139307 RepID=UPI00345BBA70
MKAKIPPIGIRRCNRRARVVNAALSAPMIALELLLWPWRLFKLLNLLVHGLGHAFALSLATRSSRYLSRTVILENIPADKLILGLLPGGNLTQGVSQTPHIELDKLTAWQCRLGAAGGIAANLSGLTAAVLRQPEILDVSPLPLVADLYVLTCFYATALLAMCSWPDIRAMLYGRAAALACGPAFAVRYGLDPEDKSSPQLVSDRLRELVEILAREASTRGGQSGGFSIIVKRLDALSVIFDKAVKGKREDIVKVVCRKMSALLTKARREGYGKAGDFEAILLHLRYATGGATHWHNAQPHWYEHFAQMTQHKVVNGCLHNVNGEVFNMIAHNGDMDGVHLDLTLNAKPFRHYFSQMEARAIFMAAMPVTTSQGNSDSRSVAEWLDFHFTQGLAYKALRYAYFTAGLDYNRDIVAGKFNLNPLLHWAEEIDIELNKLGSQNPERCLKPAAQSLADLKDCHKQRLREILRTRAHGVVAADLLDQFIARFETAFYHHDLTYVMRLASRDLVGEFALMVCSTLEPRLGVFSLTQAFSIGYNRSRNEIFGSAEPQGVTSALQHGHADDDALQIYLQDGQFATVEYRPQPGQDPIRIYDRAQADADLELSPVIAAGTVLNAPAHAEFCHWFAVNGNPKIDRHTRHEVNPTEDVGKDIKDIPYVLRRIRESFTPQGENWDTMQHFADLLLERLQDETREPDKHDLVLFGVDFNQDLVQEFSLALHSILPGLRIRAENSGNVLKEMKRTRREGIGRYSPQTLFLGVSNSAQTQSTLAAIRKAREWAGAERCFVLSQCFLNSMTQALGQGFHPEDPLLPNTFVNLSHWAPDGSCGRRRSEAATLIPVATHAVLTEILLHLAQRVLETRQALQQQGDRVGLKKPEIRHDLQLADLEAFRNFQIVVYEVEIANRVGRNAAGQPIDSPDRAALEHEAKARAENTIEFVRAYALFAAYIAIATVFGIPVFALLSAPLQTVPGIATVAHVLDAVLFLFALWLIHCGIRYWQGRPLWERIGARAELYIDRRYIARMIERYNATLFANAPAFITPFFYWADTVQDALHRFGIRAHRGVVTIHRTPDERMGVEEANNASEENMVFAQIGGIRFNGGQPQSRDKVRSGSYYMNKDARDWEARPYQLVLSDNLESLRRQYDGRLSPEVLRLVNRRLIDLCDGLIVEFVLGERRKALVNRAIWDVIRWIPGAMLLYQALLGMGIDLMNLTGEADTANQAQIQSTKHPVSPMDFHVQTMAPRQALLSFNQEMPCRAHQALGVVTLGGNDTLTIALSPLSGGVHDLPAKLHLHPGAGRDKGTLVDLPKFRKGGKFVAVLGHVAGEEHLLIRNQQTACRLAIPTALLDGAQRRFLHDHLTHHNDAWANVA